MVVVRVHGQDEPKGVTMNRGMMTFGLLLLSVPLAAADVGEEPAMDRALGHETVRIERTPIEEAIHQARLSDDMALVRELMAQIPVPKSVGGETGSEFTLRESRTSSGPGELSYESSGPESFYEDIQVRGPGEIEANPSLVTDSDGNIYAVFQTEQTVSGDLFIQAYSSTDDGETWFPFGYSHQTGADLHSPSAAVGEGGNGDSLLVAYIVDDHSNPPYPEVGISPLAGGNFTTYSLPIIGTWEAYDKPVIWTDSFRWGSWFAYITAEGVFDSAVSNVNVVFWRSFDGGTDWGTSHNTVWGNGDELEWIDPDGSYGTTYNRIFLACYNNNDDTIYVKTSDDSGGVFGAEIAVTTLSPEPPSFPVDPDIEAATGDDTVMLVGTREWAGRNNIGQTYSTDGGTTWPNQFWTLHSDMELSQFHAELTANEGGGSFFVAYTDMDYWVHFCSRPQDLSTFWSDPQRVNDTPNASRNPYPKKGIASDWTTDDVGVVWADFRLGLPSYKIFFDSTRFFGLFADGFESNNTANWDFTTP